MKKHSGYWTYEKCEKKALKYSTKTEFSKNSPDAYSAAHRYGWVSKVCEHMIEIGNLKRRCIYVFEFEDNCAYIGLTYNLIERKNEHLSRPIGSVYEHIKKTNSKYIHKQLTGYVEINDAKKLEGDYVDLYRNNGWIILNKNKTGNTGGNILHWTYEKCKEESLKYDNKEKFDRNSRGAYSSAKKNGWLDEICTHMIKIDRTKWTYEKCKDESLKYDNIKIFKKDNKNMYEKCVEKRWISDFFKYEIRTNRPKGYWTYDKCKKEALKYNNKTDFFTKSSAAYDYASRKRWIDKICSHMISKNWTKNEEEFLLNNYNNIVLCVKKLNRTIGGIMSKLKRLKIN